MLTIWEATPEGADVFASVEESVAVRYVSNGQAKFVNGRLFTTERVASAKLVTSADLRARAWAKKHAR